jgi:hypothetical protein
MCGYLSLPKNKNNIDTKWVFHNKEDKYGLMVHNMARLVAKDFSQVKGNLRCPYLTWRIGSQTRHLWPLMHIST